MARKKSRTQLEAEYSALRRSGNYRAWGHVLTSFIKWGALTLMVYFASTSVPQVAESWAGKDTKADISAEFRADIQVNNGSSQDQGTVSPAVPESSRISAIWFWAGGVWAVLGLLGLVYGYLQKRLREEALRTLGEFRQILEEQVDPNRSSSQLLPNGKEPG